LSSRPWCHPSLQYPAHRDEIRVLVQIAAVSEQTDG
jgi:hypothetical protein